jgi:Domain of unknown function (DUF6378)
MIDCQTVERTLEERGKRYGTFSEHADISQQLKDALKKQSGWYRLTPDQKEALEMICHKMARIINGDPNYADSWHDIAGYAKLIDERLTNA